MQNSPFTFIKQIKENSHQSTTYGNGVTDLIITNGIQIDHMVIHKNGSLGGSDLRPITIEIEMNSNSTYKQFKRINVRKLFNPNIRMKYILELDKGKRSIQTSIHGVGCITIPSKFKMIKH